MHPIRRIAAGLGVAAALGGCAHDVAMEDPAYAVYSALLRQVVLEEGWGGPPHDEADHRPVEELVIGRERIRGRWEVSFYARENLPALEEATVEDYARTPPPEPLERGLEGVGRYVLLSEEERAEIFDRGPLSWPGFYERFPTAPGLIRLSNVGFDEGRTQALVYMHQVREGLWGHGTLYLLERTEAAWKVVDRVVLLQH